MGFRIGNWVLHKDKGKQPFIVVKVGPLGPDDTLSHRPLAEGEVEMHAIAPDGTTLMLLDEATGRMRDAIFAAPESDLVRAELDDVPECRRWPGGKES